MPEFPAAGSGATSTIILLRRMTVDLIRCSSTTKDLVPLRWPLINVTSSSESDEEWLFTSIFISRMASTRILFSISNSLANSYTRILVMGTPYQRILNIFAQNRTDLLDGTESPATLFGVKDNR